MERLRSSAKSLGARLKYFFLEKGYKDTFFGNSYFLFIPKDNVTELKVPFLTDLEKRAIFRQLYA